MRRTATALSLLATLALFTVSGCGGKDKADAGGQGKPADGKTTQTAANSGKDPVPATSPEVNAAKTRLVGVWTGQMQVNPSKVAETLRARQEKIDDAKIKQAIDMLQSLRMKIDFGADGSMNLDASLQEQKGETEAKGVGRWELLHVKNNDVLIRSIENDKEPEEVQIHFESDTEFSMQPPKEYSGIGMMRFRKMR